jgi:hypothetical protein
MGVWFAGEIIMMSAARVIGLFAKAINESAVHYVHSSVEPYASSVAPPMIAVARSYTESYSPPIMASQFMASQDVVVPEEPAISPLLWGAFLVLGAATLFAHLLCNSRPRATPLPLADQDIDEGVDDDVPEEELLKITVLEKREGGEKETNDERLNKINFEKLVELNVLEKVPDLLRCPITLGIFTHAATATDKRNYEKKAIKQFISQQQADNVKRKRKGEKAQPLVGVYRDPIRADVMIDNTDLAIAARSFTDAAERSGRVFHHTHSIFSEMAKKNKDREGNGYVSDEKVVETASLIMQFAK